MHIKWVIAAAGGVLAGAVAAGASQTTGAEFLRDEISAKPAALAAGVAGQWGSDGLAWNPAGILGAANPELAFSRFAGLADTVYEQAEGLYPGWLGGSWAARILYASTYNFVEYDSQGTARGTIDNYNLLVHVAYAWPFANNFTGGMAVKIFHSVYGDFQNFGLALDLGYIYQTGWQPLTLGLTVQNLGAMTAFDQEADPLPLQIGLGAALSVFPGTSYGLRCLADYHQPLNGDTSAILALGLEYNLLQTVYARGGYRFTNDLGQWSVGAGVRLGSVELDYAYRPMGSLGDNQFFTLSFALSPPGKEFAAAAPPAPAPTPAAVKAPAEPAPRPPVPPAAAVLPPAAAALAAPPTQIPVPASPPPMAPIPADLFTHPYLGKMSFNPVRLAGFAQPWTATVRDSSQRVLKTFAGTNFVPAQIIWDGKDERGLGVLNQAGFSFQLSVESLAPMAFALPGVTLPVKLQFADGSWLEPEVHFRFAGQPELESLSLTVWNARTREVVARYAADSPLPEEWVWNGRTPLGKPAETSQVYQYGLDLRYPKDIKFVLTDWIRPVAARRVAGAAGAVGVLIPGVWFDKHRASLPPEILDKLMAAAELLRRYPGRAAAVCEGYSADENAFEANRRLSDERAQAMADVLKKIPGVSPTAVSCKSLGSSRPEADPSARDGRGRRGGSQLRVFIPAPAGSPAPVGKKRPVGKKHPAPRLVARKGRG